MGGRSWTEREDATLRAYASLGVRKVSALLREECGSRRSEYAIQCRASRIGVSLFRHGACTCGRLSRKLNAEGLCPVCAARKSASAAQMRAYLMEATRITKEDGDAISKARREGAAARKRCSSMRRKGEDDKAHDK